MNKFTEAYFLEECTRFRAMLGERSFWNKGPEKCEAALRGLTHVYLNIFNDDGSSPSDEQMQKWAQHWEVLAREFNWRAAFAL